MATDLIPGILKGVLAMALADGELQEGEREVLALLQDRFSLEEGELAGAIGDARDFSPEELRSLDHDDRVTVAQYVVMAAWADGNVEDSEQRFLEKLELKLGLNTEDVQRLERFSADLAKVAKRRPVNIARLNEVLETWG